MAEPGRDHLLDELRSLLAKLATQHDISAEEALALTARPSGIPLSIFATERGPLESLVVYLRDESKLEFSQISSLLSRSYQNVWGSYRAGSKKSAQAMPSAQALALLRAKGLPSLASITIPHDLFCGKLSIYEALIRYLHEDLRMRFCDIALLLNRDDRTVWTIYSRSRKKGERHEKT